MLTAILLVALVLVLLDDLCVRASLRDRDGEWLHVLGEKDEQLARLRRR